MIRWKDLVSDYLEEEQEMREFTKDLYIPFTIKHFKLYRKAERFDQVLNFNPQLLDEYLNLIATKKRKLEGILFGTTSEDIERVFSENAKVLEAMNFIIERTTINQ